MGPLDASRPWSTQDIVGVHKFLQRFWRNVVDEDTGELHVVDVPADDETRRLLHRTIDDGAAHDMAELEFNTAIAALMELNNRLTQVVQDEGQRAARGRAGDGAHAVAAHAARRRGAVGAPRRGGSLAVRPISRSPIPRCSSTTPSRSRCRSTARCGPGSRSRTGASEAEHEAAARSDAQGRRAARRRHRPQGRGRPRPHGQLRPRLNPRSLRQMALPRGTGRWYRHDRSSPALPPVSPRAPARRARRSARGRALSTIVTVVHRGTRRSGSAEFHDDPGRRAACAPRPSRAPRAGGSHAWPMRPLTRLIDRVHDWRADARFGVVVLVAGRGGRRRGLVPHRRRRCERGRVGRAARGHAPRASTTTLDDRRRRRRRPKRRPRLGDRGARRRRGDPPGGGRAARGGPGHRRGRGGGRRAGRRRPRPAEPGGQGHRRRTGLRGQGRAGRPGSGRRRRRRRVRPGWRHGHRRRRRGEGQPQHRDAGPARGAAGHRAHVRAGDHRRACSAAAGSRSVNELRSVRGIGDKRFAELAPLVTV